MFKFTFANLSEKTHLSSSTVCTRILRNVFLFSLTTKVLRKEMVFFMSYLYLCQCYQLFSISWSMKTYRSLNPFKIVCIWWNWWFKIYQVAKSGTFQIVIASCNTNSWQHWILVVCTNDRRTASEAMINDRIPLF